MLDEKTEDLNSEKLTEKTSSNSEIENSELTENATTDKDQLESEIDENISVSENVINEKVDTEKDTSKPTSEEKTSKKIEIIDEKVNDKVSSNKTSSKKEKATKEDDNEKVKADKPKNTVDKKKVDEEKVVEKIDYGKFDLEQLVEEFQTLLKQEAIPVIKGKIEKIKESFNLKYGELLIENKKTFLAEGGNEVDFYYTNPIKSVYNDLLFEFKTKRQHYYKQLEEEQKENLSKKLALIDDLKQLIDNAESSSMYQHFKEIQQKWSAIGNIPRAKYNDTWRTYHHHVERFYDLLHLSNDLRDLDFKHNLEEKLKLVEKAEELSESNDLNKAFKELQVLHKLWKEDIGPVDRAHREEIWERFSKATKKIHDKRHDLQKSLESKYEENIVKKREVINKIAQLTSENIVSHKVWQLKINELEGLRQEFFKIGRVPRAQNNKIWGEFKEATRNFNRVKNLFYKDIKKDQQENLDKKNALVEKAELLKDSDDWDTTTELMKQIQSEWKTIGHVPRKYSDKIWKQFKDACNYYFDRLHGVQDEANKDQVEVFNKKKELLANLKSKSDDKAPLTLEDLNKYNDDWNKLGNLPNNMHHLEVKFNKTLNNLYGKLNLDEKEIAMLKFKNIVNNYLSHKNLRKLDSEQLFVRKKVDELTREIQQLETNISFISNASDDNPILKNVHQNIQNHNEQLDIWKTKLDYLTKLNY